LTSEASKWIWALLPSAYFGFSLHGEKRLESPYPETRSKIPGTLPTRAL